MLFIIFAACSIILKYALTPMEKLPDQIRPIPASFTIFFTLSILLYHPVVPTTMFFLNLAAFSIFPITAFGCEKSTQTSTFIIDSSLISLKSASSAVGSMVLTEMPLASAAISISCPILPYPIIAMFILFYTPMYALKQLHKPQLVLLVQKLGHQVCRVSIYFNLFKFIFCAPHFRFRRTTTAHGKYKHLNS